MIACRNELSCSGCEACVQICPIGCISLSRKRGFYYPEIDENACLKCKKCESVCPVIKQPITDKHNSVVCDSYVAYSKNAEVRYNSSSGGVFFSIAEHVIEKGGYVCGAAWINKYVVQHIIIQTKEQIQKLIGSKYIQSRIGTAYTDIRRLLDSGNIVLFTGTACQVAGLLSFLPHKYSNLITMDVFCHGVPSPQVWEKNVDHIESIYSKTVERVNFRDKCSGWKNYTVTYYTDDDKTIQISHYDDKYMRIFLSDIALRDSCYNCVFKSFPRCSDLSIGDAWDGRNLISDIEDHYGLSAVIINSTTGRRVFESILSTLYVKKVNLNSLVPPLSDARKAVMQHPNRNKFLSDLEGDGDFVELYNDIRLTRIQRLQHYLHRIPLYAYKMIVQKVLHNK